MEGRYGFWGAIIAALIGAAITYYTYSSDKREEEKKAKAEIAKIEQEKKSSIARVSIEELFLPSINTELDSVFFLKLSNNSYNNAKDLDVKINFGEAEVTKCEVQPKLENKGNLDSSIYNYSITELKKDDSLYIYCTLSNPIFDQILINGSNLEDNVKMTFDSYKLKKKKEVKEKDDGITFFEFLFRAVLFVFTGYFTLLSITLINRKLKLE